MQGTLSTTSRPPESTSRVSRRLSFLACTMLVVAATTLYADAPGSVAQPSKGPPETLASRPSASPGVLAGELPRLITLSFTMAAFLATFYALLRNNPSLRPEAGGVFYSIAFALISGVLFLSVALIRDIAPTVYLALLVAGGSFFLGTVALLLRVFWRSYVRMNYLHEGRGSGKFFIVSRLYRRLRPKRKTYEFEVGARSLWERHEGHLFAEMSDELFKRLQAGGSLLLLSADMCSLRKSVIQFVGDRLKAGDSVNYVTCAEAPFRIMTALESLRPDVPLGHLVFIDAFSRTFGFKDDIVDEVSLRVAEKGLTAFRASTCAGVHRAINPHVA